MAVSIKRPAQITRSEFIDPRGERIATLLGERRRSDHRREVVARSGTATQGRALGIDGADPARFPYARNPRQNPFLPSHHSGPFQENAEIACICSPVCHGSQWWIFDNSVDCFAGAERSGSGRSPIFRRAPRMVPRIVPARSLGSEGLRRREPERTNPARPARVPKPGKRTQETEQTNPRNRANEPRKPSKRTQDRRVGARVGRVRVVPSDRRSEVESIVGGKRATTAVGNRNDSAERSDPVVHPGDSGAATYAGHARNSVLVRSPDRATKSTAGLPHPRGTCGPARGDVWRPRLARGRSGFRA